MIPRRHSPIDSAALPPLRQVAMQAVRGCPPTSPTDCLAAVAGHGLATPANYARRQGPPPASVCSRQSLGQGRPARRRPSSSRRLPSPRLPAGRHGRVVAGPVRVAALTPPSTAGSLAQLCLWVAAGRAPRRYRQSSERRRSPAAQMQTVPKRQNRENERCRAGVRRRARDT